MAAGNLRYVIDVDDNGTASIRKFDQTAGESLDRTAKKTAGLGDAFLKVGRIALTAAGLIAGALGGIGLAKAVGEAVSFNKAFAGVVSLFGDGQRATAAFGRDLGSVQGELSDMSGRLGTTTELARVLYQTISSGVPAAKAMETVRAAAELAAAGMADAEESSKLLTTVLNAFPGVARGAAGASDLLFRTTKQGKVEISDLNASFGNLLPAAQGANVALEEVAAGVAALSLTQPAAIAMTNLKASFTSFLADGEKFKKAGIDIQKVMSEEGLAGVLGVLRERFAGNAQGLLKITGSAEAVAGIMPLITTQFASFNQFLDENKTGSGEVAEANRILAMSYEGMAKELEGRVTAALRELADTALRELTPTILDLTARLKEFSKSDEFKQFLSDAARFIRELVVEGRALAAWVVEHKSLLLTLGQVIAAVFVANKVRGYATEVSNALRLMRGDLTGVVGTATNASKLLASSGTSLLRFGSDVKTSLSLAAGSMATWTSGAASFSTAAAGAWQSLTLVAAPAALVVAALAACGIAVKKILDTWAEYEEELGAVADAEAQLSEVQLDAYRRFGEVAKANGIAIGELKEKYGDLIGLNRAAREGDEKAIAILETYRGKLQERKDAEAGVTEASRALQDTTSKLTATMADASLGAQEKAAAVGVLKGQLERLIATTLAAGPPTQAEADALNLARAQLELIAAQAPGASKGIGSVGDAAAGAKSRFQEMVDSFKEAGDIFTQGELDKKLRALDVALKQLGTGTITPKLAAEIMELSAAAENAGLKVPAAFDQIRARAQASLDNEATKKLADDLLETANQSQKAAATMQGALLKVYDEASSKGLKMADAVKGIEEKIVDFVTAARAAGRDVPPQIEAMFDAAKANAFSEELKKAREALQTQAGVSDEARAKTQALSEALDAAAGNQAAYDQLVRQNADSIQEMGNRAANAGPPFGTLADAQQRLIDLKAGDAVKQQAQQIKEGIGLIDPADLRVRGEALREALSAAERAGPGSQEAIRALIPQVQEYVAQAKRAGVEVPPELEKAFDSQRVSSFGQTFSGVLQGILSGTMSFKQALGQVAGNLFEGLLGSLGSGSGGFFQRIAGIFGGGGQKAGQSMVSGCLGAVTGGGGKGGLFGSLGGLFGGGGGGGGFKSMLGSFFGGGQQAGGELAKGAGTGLQGGMSKAAGYAGAISSVFSTFKDKYASSGQKVGAAVGAGIGAAFGGPVGASIGSALGKAIGGIFSKPEWKKVQSDIKKRLGTELSEAAAKAIVDMKKALGVSRNVAELLALPEIAKDAKLSADNVGKFANEFLNLGKLATSGKKGSEEALKALGQSFSILTSKMEEAGLTGTKAFGQMVEGAKQFIGKVPEITQFFEQGLKQAADGANAFVASLGDVSKGFDGMMSDGEAAGVIVKNVFDAMLVLPGGARKALEALGGSVDALKEKYQKLGIAMPPEVADLISLRDKYKNIEPMLGRVDALTNILQGLGKTGFIAADTFRVMQEQIVGSSRAMEAAGLSEMERLRAIAPALQEIVNEHQRNGAVIDANTQGLIDQAAAVGLVKQEGTDMFSRMRQESNYMLGGIAAIFGKKGAFQQYLGESGQAASQTFSGMQTSFGTATAGMTSNWQQTTSSWTGIAAESNAQTLASHGTTVEEVKRYWREQAAGAIEDAHARGFGAVKVWTGFMKANHDQITAEIAAAHQTAAGVSTEAWKAQAEESISATESMTGTIAKGLEELEARGLDTSSAIAASVQETTTALITGAEQATSGTLFKLGKFSEALADRLADLAERRAEAEGGEPGSGGRRQYHKGGYVFGAVGDAHRGEYVIREDAVDAIGVRDLEFMNREKKLPASETTRATGTYGAPARASGGGSGVAFSPTINAVFQLEDGTRFPARVVEWVQDAADDGRLTVGPDNIKDRG